MPKELHDLTVTLVHETDKAYLINDGGNEDKWVPKSVAEMEKNRDGTYTMTIPMSWAHDKGYI